MIHPAPPGEKCSICQMEFPSSPAQPALIDGVIRGVGRWGYVCRSHTGHLALPSSDTREGRRQRRLLARLVRSYQPTPLR